MRSILIVTALALAAPATAASASCENDANWFSKREGNDCDWVAKKARRCKVKTKNDDGVSAFTGCPAACDTCDLSCAEDATSDVWYVKKRNKDCDWVSKNGKRCKKTDNDNFDVPVPAEVACPEACDNVCEDTDPTAAPTAAPFAATAAPTPAPFAATASPTAAPLSGTAHPTPRPTWTRAHITSHPTPDADGAAGADSCIDSYTWFVEGDPAKRCSWVRQEPEERCEKDGDDGTAAWERCVGSCGCTSAPTPFVDPNVPACGSYDLFDARDAWLDPYGDAEPYGDIKDWDTSCSGRFFGLFSGYYAGPTAEAFNGDIGGWDTSSVTEMQYMFEGSDLFNRNLNAWDVSQVRTMSYMFAFAASFNGDISAWDVGNVGSMSNMFKTSGFNGDISAWDVSSVGLFYGTFHFANYGDFNADLSSWDVSGVAYMNQMFDSCGAFNAAIEDWDVSSSITMSRMFFNAASFDRDLGAWDVSRVTNIDAAFNGASALTSGPGWCVGEGTTWTSAFDGSGCGSAAGCGVTRGDCTARPTPSPTADDGRTAAPTPRPTPRPSRSPTPGPSGAPSSAPTFCPFHLAARVPEYLEDAETSEAAHGPIGDWDVSCATDLTNLFRDAEAFNGDIGGWDTSSVTTMKKIFKGAAAFNADVSGWDVASVLDVSAAFAGAASFDRDLGWCFGDAVVLDLGGAFDGAACEGSRCGVTVGACACFDGRAPLALSRDYLRGFHLTSSWGTNLPHTIFAGDTFKYAATEVGADSRRLGEGDDRGKTGARSIEDDEADAIFRGSAPPRASHAPARAAARSDTLLVYDSQTCVDGSTQPRDVLLYDDGTHGDDFAGDGVYSRACLHLCAGARDDDVYDIFGFARHGDSFGGRLMVVDPALRGSVPIVDLPTPAEENVTVRATAHAIYFADTDRVHMPNWPSYVPRDILWTGNSLPARAAVSVFGDVFDFITIYPMEPVREGGGGIMKWQDWTRVGGPNKWTDPTHVGKHSDCMRALDGVEHPKIRGIIWISDEHMLWKGVLEHEILHATAGFGYHSEVDGARDGDGAHVPGSCTDDHSVLQGPVWDWVEGGGVAVPGDPRANGPVRLVANDDCAECDDLENCCTFRYEDFPHGAEEMVARPDLNAASDLLLYISGFLPGEDVADHSKVGYCVGTDTDGGCGAREGKPDCDPDVYVDDSDRNAIRSNNVNRFTFEELVASRGGARDPPGKRDSPATRQAVVYVGGRVPEEAEWTYKELYWRYFDTMDEPFTTAGGTIHGWKYTTRGTNALVSKLNGIPCGEPGAPHALGCEAAADDQCDGHTCHERAKCLRMDVAYACVCEDGYYGDGLSCVLPDETEGYPLEDAEYLAETGQCGIDRWWRIDPTLHERPYPGGVAPYSPIACGDTLCPLGEACVDGACE